MPVETSETQTPCARVAPYPSPPTSPPRSLHSPRKLRALPSQLNPPSVRVLSLILSNPSLHHVQDVYGPPRATPPGPDAPSSLENLSPATRRLAGKTQLTGSASLSMSTSMVLSSPSLTPTPPQCKKRPIPPDVAMRGDYMSAERAAPRRMLFAPISELELSKQKNITMALQQRARIGYTSKGDSAPYYRERCSLAYSSVSEHSSGFPYLDHKTTVSVEDRVIPLPLPREVHPQLWQKPYNRKEITPQSDARKFVLIKNVERVLSAIKSVTLYSMTAAILTIENTVIVGSTHTTSSCGEQSMKRRNSIVFGTSSGTHHSSTVFGRWILSLKAMLSSG